MKKLTATAGVFIAGLMIFLLILAFPWSSSAAQEKSFIESSLVLNIEIPVRVFDGGKFVGNLARSRSAPTASARCRSNRAAADSPPRGRGK